MNITDSETIGLDSTTADVAVLPTGPALTPAAGTVATSCQRMCRCVDRFRPWPRRSVRTQESVSSTPSSARSSARVEIALYPYVTHHLTVYGQVKGFEWNGCIYESYVKSTTSDRYGAPLVIRQLGASGSVCYLPLVYRAADPARTPPPSAGQ